MFIYVTSSHYDAAQPEQHIGENNKYTILFSPISQQLDQLKPAPEEPESRYSLPLNCSRMERLRTRRSQHYAASVSMDESSVYVTQEVYPCGEE
jgi:hypothetical protein